MKTDINHSVLKILYVLPPLQITDFTDSLATGIPGQMSLASEMPKMKHVQTAGCLLGSHTWGTVA
jgi:hypothetical protein